MPTTVSQIQLCCSNIHLKTRIFSHRKCKLTKSLLGPSPYSLQLSTIIFCCVPLNLFAAQQVLLYLSSSPFLAQVFRSISRLIYLTGKRFLSYLSYIFCSLLDTVEHTADTQNLYCAKLSTVLAISITVGRIKISSNCVGYLYCAVVQETWFHARRASERMLLHFSRPSSCRLIPSLEQ
jgi:hypothetical protein